MAKAHDEGAPLVWVNVVFSTGNQNGWVDMGSHDPDFERQGRLSLVRASAKWMTGLENGFQLDWAFMNAWRLH